MPFSLAGIPLLNQVPNGPLLFNVTFVCVVFGMALQGATIAPLARWLGLSEAKPPASPLRIELLGAAPSGSAVLDVHLDATAPAVGRCLADLSLPEDVVVAALYRDGALIAPRGDVVSNAGDHVYLLSEDAEKSPLPAVFAAEPDGDTKLDAVSNNESA